jgi:hypothetical protein
LEVDWLCNWLYNPRADQKARVLMLFQGAGYYRTPFLERLKEVFEFDIWFKHLSLVQALWPLQQNFLLFL